MSSSSCCPGAEPESVCGVDTLGLGGISASTRFATSDLGACAPDVFPICLARGPGDSVFLALSLDAAGAGEAPCFRCVEVVDKQVKQSVSSYSVNAVSRPSRLSWHYVLSLCVAICFQFPYTFLNVLHTCLKKPVLSRRDTQTMGCWSNNLFLSHAPGMLDH